MARLGVGESTRRVFPGSASAARMPARARWHLPCRCRRFVRSGSASACSRPGRCCPRCMFVILYVGPLKQLAGLALNSAHVDLIVWSGQRCRLFRKREFVLRLFSAADLNYRQSDQQYASTQNVNAGESCRCLRGLPSIGTDLGHFVGYHQTNRATSCFLRRTHAVILAQLFRHDLNSRPQMHYGSPISSSSSPWIVESPQKTFRSMLLRIQCTDPSA